MLIPLSLVGVRQSMLILLLLTPCDIAHYDIASPCLQRELKCCWDCRRCRSNERLNAAITGCVTCDLLTWPDDVNHTTCVRIEPTYLQWDDMIGIGLAILGCVGILSTLVVTVLFVMHRNRKVIKGSSKELCGIIIVGLFVAYLTVLAFIYEPTTWSCYVNYFGFNISIAAIFAPLFLKTNRMYRLFAAAERCQLRVKLISTGSQMVIATIAVTVQVSPRPLQRCFISYYYIWFSFVFPTSYTSTTFMDALSRNDQIHILKHNNEVLHLGKS